jgi:hypothetical protein
MKWQDFFATPSIFYYTPYFFKPNPKIKTMLPIKYEKDDISRYEKWENNSNEYTMKSLENKKKEVAYWNDLVLNKEETNRNVYSLFIGIGIGFGIGFGIKFYY